MATKPEQRKYWREEDARAFVDEHAASGLTIAAFAAARGIPAQRLNRWRRRFEVRSVPGARRGPVQEAGAAPAVVRIARVERLAAASSATPSPSPLPSSGAVLTVELGEARVRVPAGCDAVTVEVVLGALWRRAHGATR